ncbi:unnamed protein product, partial [Allacma fusca]
QFQSKTTFNCTWKFSQGVKEILAPCFFVPDPSVEVPQVIAFASNPAKRDATRLVKARFN